MEIKVYNPTQTQPLPPVQWNYEEVKQYVQDGLSRYKGIIYDDTQIANAKADRATLNKLAAAIDAKRKEMKTLYLEPYTEFEAQAKELTAMVKMQVDEIDAQVKAFDNFRREEKLAQIKAEIYTPMIGNLAELVPYEKIHNPKWLNVTTSMTAIGEDMARIVEKIENGLKSIDQLNLATDITERVKSVFLQDFNLGAAIAEKVRIETERGQMERYEAAQKAQSAPVAVETPGGENTQAVAEPPSAPQEQPATDEKTYSVTFRIHVTKAQLDLLGAFMKSHGIKPERV